MHLGLSMTPSLRLTLECRVCRILGIDTLPEHQVPRDPVTGKIIYALCFQLGVCPCCKTIHDLGFSIDEWKGIVRRDQARLRRLSRRPS